MKNSRSLQENLIKLCVFVVVGYTAVITIYSTFMNVGITGIQLQLGSATLLFFYPSRPKTKFVKWDRPKIVKDKKENPQQLQISKINQ